MCLLCLSSIIEILYRDKTMRIFAKDSQWECTVKLGASNILCSKTAVSNVLGLSTFLQALHFFIGFGALVSPLIADPFLSETGCGNHTGNETEVIHHFRSMLRNSPIVEHSIPLSNLSHGVEKEESSVHYAFWIMALINVRS